MNKEEYRLELSKIIYMMAEVFRDKANEVLVDGWMAVLASEKVTIEEAQAAAIEIMRSRVFNKLPPPAVFLEVLRPKTKPEEIAVAQAEKQADYVLSCVRRAGPYAFPVFSDSITDYLMTERWPWTSFAETLEADKTKWWRRDFVDAYRGMMDKPQLTSPEPKGLLEDADKKGK